jgi:hypothetical protein
MLSLPGGHVGGLRAAPGKRDGLHPAEWDGLLGSPLPRGGARPPRSSHKELLLSKARRGAAGKTASSLRKGHGEKKRGVGAGRRGARWDAETLPGPRPRSLLPCTMHSAGLHPGQSLPARACAPSSPVLTLQPPARQLRARSGRLLPAAAAASFLPAAFRDGRFRVSARRAPLRSARHQHADPGGAQAK